MYFDVYLVYLVIVFRVFGVFWCLFGVFWCLFGVVWYIFFVYSNKYLVYSNVYFLNFDIYILCISKSAFCEPYRLLVPVCAKRFEFALQSIQSRSLANLSVDQVPFGYRNHCSQAGRSFDSCVISWICMCYFTAHGAISGHFCVISRHPT
jgi:hypothetical protein